MLNGQGRGRGSRGRGGLIPRALFDINNQRATFGQPPHIFQGPTHRMPYTQHINRMHTPPPQRPLIPHMHHYPPTQGPIFPG